MHNYVSDMYWVRKAECVLEQCSEFMATGRTGLGACVHVHVSITGVVLLSAINGWR